jgi:dihydroneopterin aldolase
LVEDVVRPRLAFVSNAAIALAELKTRIADLTAQDAPLVLCVGMPDIAIVQVAGDGAQRRVDLLAIEQNALRVSTLVPDCAVVATRTELDWAMKNGHVCVWAPSKIVLDAVDGPQGHDGLSLARWLAAELGAVELIEL